MDFMTDRLFKYKLNHAAKTATLLEPINGVSQFYANHVKVAKMIGDYTITKIGPCAFSKSTTLTIIEIPDTVSLIDDSAFSNCGSLEKVYFYSTQTNRTLINIFGSSDKKLCLGSNAFAGCAKLHNIDSLFLQLSDNSFFNCSSLKNITFTHSSKWHPSTFTGCSNLYDILFLGEVDDSLPDICIEWLKDKNIECPDDSKLVNLAYEGTNVKILPF